ncbi:phospholipase A and acyltransferase 4 [Salmo salar]|uniref:Phospholipase A and acyltransferase 4-like n=1 Tax=Salmo salar TaxID=8030 RepID=A0A1S3KKE2_SALSA|nr:phospholipase A and acyltransferase 4 [Salmo salar]XP_045567122.1 phospholipase A and acyltransferase 4-like [Salmo salar]|eukprot:XP_013979123.1 PREDICTED: retinoic acid receptor responder protein 3-like [Salmo salar]
MKTRSPTTMEIGDMIEINRGPYKHWALYIGNGEVIHLVTPDGPSRVVFCSVSSSSGSLSCKGMVTIEKLKDVAAGNTYKINNYLDDEYKPRPTDVIMGEVDKMRGRTIKYGLLGNNCEHFVTFLRYGKSESKQADDFMKNVLAGQLGLFGVMAAVAVSTVAAASTVSK